MDSNLLDTSGSGCAPVLPDITLRLDADAVIRAASFANGVADEPVGDWIGRDWSATVGEGARDALRRLLETLRGGGVAASGRIEQRLPSGRLLHVDYTAVRLDQDQGIVAVGRHSNVVAELQARLLDAQQTIERDSWKLRAVETRYRLLFDAAAEALITLDRTGRQVLEVNPMAAGLLGLASRGRSAARGADLRSWLSDGAQSVFARLLERVRDHGGAPAVLLELADGKTTLLVRASLIGSGEDLAVLLQAVPAATAETPVGGAVAEPGHVPAVPGAASAQNRADHIQAALIERSPDGHLILDRRGIILRANAAFVDMAQAGSESAVLGESFGRWLGRRGVDLADLLASVERFGSVRLFSAHIVGSLDNEIEVEISAVGDRGQDTRLIGVSVRDVGRRRWGREARSDAGLARRIGRAPLGTLVEETVAEVERTSVQAALALTGDSRTAAAELLGISRQSLEGKIKRHGLADDRDASATGGGTS